MKNRYVIWMLALMASLSGCKDLTCDFGYSPQEPRAGEKVTFINRCTGADKYDWSFGDNISSDAAAPSHIYRKPGTYTVRLMVYRGKVQKRSRSMQITILDTIPTIAMDTDSIYTFTPVTFTAKIYNPWKKEVTYQWQLDEKTVLMSNRLDSSSVKCYFQFPKEKQSISLHLTMGNLDTTMVCTKPVYIQSAPVVLYKSGDAAYMQRYYTMQRERKYQQSEIATNAQDLALLDAEQDTVAQYGDTVLTISKVAQLTGLSVQGFQIDRVAGKLYVRASNGLYVANVNGSCLKSIDAQTISAIKVDAFSNRIYWAVPTWGLYEMRLVQTRDNSFEREVYLVNDAEEISAIAVNPIKH